MRVTPLIAFFLVAPANAESPQGSPATREASLQSGIRQVDDGDFQGAILTLDQAIQTLTAGGIVSPKELAQAHLYKGVAFVGLLQEGQAKSSFRQALLYDSELRLAKGQFPDRVVRVFEATRKGETKSVMKRPSSVPRKAGIGGVGIAAIVGGVLALGGVAAAAAGGSGPPPTPQPTPDPSRLVTPTATSGPGQILFVNADPAPGSVISGCGADLYCPQTVGMNFDVRPTVDIGSANSGRDLYLAAFLYSGTRLCLSARGNSLPFLLPAGQTQRVGVAFFTDHGCVPPVSVDGMVAALYESVGGSSLLQFRQDWRLTFAFNP